MADELDFLDVYDTQSLSDEGAWVTLWEPGSTLPARHARTGDILRVKVLGPDSVKRARLAADYDRAVSTATYGSPDQQLDPTVLWDIQEQFFPKIAVDWEGFGLPFTEDRFRKAMAKQRAFGAQAWNYSGARAGFLRRSAPDGSATAANGLNDPSSSASGRRTAPPSASTSS